MKIQQSVFSAGVLALLLAGAGQVAWANAAGVTVASVQVSNSTGTSGGVLEVYITTSQTVYNPAGCEAPDGYITEDPIIANATYAGALAALASGASVTLAISTSQCAGNRPMIVTFQVN